jgi:hypothetical protein
MNGSVSATPYVTDVVTKIKPIGAETETIFGGGAGAPASQPAKNAGAGQAYRLSLRGEGAAVKTA